MRAFPRWRNLKHFDHVTTIDFSDGQTFYDILKVSFLIQSFRSLTIMQCLVYCVVPLLPPGSSLVHCLRAYVKFRILVGMTTLTESRKEILTTVIAEYDKACSVGELLHVYDFNQGDSGYLTTMEKTSASPSSMLSFM